MAYFYKIPTMSLWYYHIKAADLKGSLEKTSKEGVKNARKIVRKARTHSHEQTLKKLTFIEGHQRQIINDPPLIVPLKDVDLEIIIGETGVDRISEDTVEYAWNGYLASLPDERRFLLQRFSIVDVAFRVGGIGSVGTRCLIVLLKGGAKNDYLLLQLKEATPSILAPYLPTQKYESQAQRVVTGQHLMQAASDMFLGWHRGKYTGYEFYWRQLKDMKGSANIANLSVKGMHAYLAVCAWCLARGHARTGDEVKISGYLGRKGNFANSIADFAVAYADQVERDYQALVHAVKYGQISAEVGI
jgi:uncharacterized protein (DUF2252 family)